MILDIHQCDTMSIISNTKSYIQIGIKAVGTNSKMPLKCSNMQVMLNVYTFTVFSAIFTKGFLLTFSDDYSFFRTEI